MDRITIYFSFIIDRKDKEEYLKSKEKKRSYGRRTAIIEERKKAVVEANAWE